MKIRVKVLWIAALYILFVGVIVALYQGKSIFYITQNFSTISYQDNLSNVNWFAVKSWVLIYGIVAFFVTNSILGKTDKIKWFPLFICSVYDIAVYFGSIFLMVIYNNIRFEPDTVVPITSTDSVFVLALFQIAKRVILRLYYKNTFLSSEGL
ncbi:hypothetical protein L3C95_30745 [Chitinophaga filiformis]|uniref:hypothetical protein n=1 Tax=Chitinophaga filiformis TaxID=104663 RepID=UPI001F3ED914|nr:hypothetical protein [Chitinophaga filiformis]MCF6407313.1 hypothetical protein [Chitinophaga filiformis]